MEIHVAGCPFCGQVNRLTIIRNDRHYHVECQNCGARGPGTSNMNEMLELGEKRDIAISTWSSIPQAIEDWNNRQKPVV